MTREDRFSHFIDSITAWTGSPVAVSITVLLGLGWLILLFSLGVNSALWSAGVSVTNLVTFTMVFLLQHGNNRAMRAMHAKLDALVLAAEAASNDLIGVEQSPEPVISVTREAALDALQEDE